MVACAIYNINALSARIATLKFYGKSDLCESPIFDSLAAFATLRRDVFRDGRGAAGSLFALPTSSEAFFCTRVPILGWGSLLVNDPILLELSFSLGSDIFGALF
jgi:hypothetical protein